MAAQGPGDKKRPIALKLASSKDSVSSDSSSEASLKGSRTPRFAEATTVHSPVESRSPFADPESAEAKPSDVGFGYIGEAKIITMAPKTPLKSAMRVPGTPGKFTNPLSPTFREEDLLEKREGATDKQQSRDLKIKTRVRMAKFALRGVNFSCSLIVLAMISSSFSIFNATKDLPAKSGSIDPWSGNTDTWPELLVLSMSCVSLGISFFVFIAYCRGGHRRAEKVGTYYTMFAIGWFIVSMILWLVTATLFQSAKTNPNVNDIWSWSCASNTRSTDFSSQVNYQLVCRLQNWSLVCIIIEVVVEAISIALYTIVFYRYYTKRRLTKTMDSRDRARSDLYLAQLRTQSAPNTPGFGPRTPGLSMKSPTLSHYAMSPRHPPEAYRSLADINESSPYTPGGRIVEPSSLFNQPQAGFKLQAPPVKAPSATPKMGQGVFTTIEAVPTPSVSQHAPVAADEPVYDAVPIPGAYAGQAIKSPPPTQTSFGQGR